MPPAALPAAAAAPAETAPPGAWILGRGKLRPENLAAFLLGQNAEADAAFVRNLADCYAQEAETEGIDSDVAFAQMCIETGFLRYGGLVTPDMNNFCGLGSLGPGIPGERFPSPQLGVRAHIQHLKAYATEKPLEGELIDPRYHLVKKGSAPTVDRLAGRWAADREYGKKIEGLLERLYAFSAETP
jgi:hypothetical protein